MHTLKIYAAKATIIRVAVFAAICPYCARAVYCCKSADTGWFYIKNAGLSVEGTFGEAIADIGFDEQKPENSSFSAKINVGSINTGIRDRDRHLLKEDYFHAAQYPDIQAKSRRVSRKDGQNWEGEFDLTMRGVTKTLIIPFTYRKTAAGAVFSAQFTVNRLDFQVGKSSWIMGDEVKVRVEIIAQ